VSFSFPIPFNEEDKILYPSPESIKYSPGF